MPHMHSLLIIGCGSIGERHLRCFQKTQRATVSACDTSAALLATMRERYGVETFDSLDAALAKGRFDAAVICTPAPLHLPMALKLVKAGLHVFIEKPLAIDAAMAPQVRDAITQAKRFAAVAYVYHNMPWVAATREFLRKDALGQCLHASTSTGQHFPTFRPAYRDIYYARHDQGGGAVQDALTHVVNAVEWIIGPTTRVFCDASHQALEGVKVEDTVNICARHGDILVSHAMNQFQAPNESLFLFHCEKGSVRIEGHAQRWGTMRHGEKEWSWHQTPPMERDDIFIAQASAFLDGMEGQTTSLCTFDEALQTLKFNQAALRSISTGLPITLS